MTRFARSLAVALTAAVLSSACVNITVHPTHGAVQVSNSVKAKPAASEAEIAALFDRWNASLATGNPDDVAANYAVDAILLPTVSNKVRHNHAEIRDYFVHFLEKKPRGVILERNIRFPANHVAIDSGTYAFDTISGRVPARYTFVYRKTGKEWLIVEHHSSAMPEKPGSKSH